MVQCDVYETGGCIACLRNFCCALKALEKATFKQSRKLSTLFGEQIFE
jgi:hypothetical protein